MMGLAVDKLPNRRLNGYDNVDLVLLETSLEQFLCQTPALMPSSQLKSIIEFDKHEENNFQNNNTAKQPMLPFLLPFTSLPSLEPSSYLFDYFEPTDNHIPASNSYSPSTNPRKRKFTKPSSPSQPSSRPFTPISPSLPRSACSNNMVIGFTHRPPSVATILHPLNTNNNNWEIKPRHNNSMINTERKTLKKTFSGSSFGSIDLETVLFHQVGKTDTWQGLSLRYGVAISEICRLNKLYSTDSIHLRKVLLIPFVNRDVGYSHDDIDVENNRESLETQRRPTSWVSSVSTGLSLSDTDEFDNEETFDNDNDNEEETLSTSSYASSSYFTSASRVSLTAINTPTTTQPSTPTSEFLQKIDEQVIETLSKIQTNTPYPIRLPAYPSHPQSLHLLQPEHPYNEPTAKTIKGKLTEQYKRFSRAFLDKWIRITPVKLPEPVVVHNDKFGVNSTRSQQSLGRSRRRSLLDVMNPFRSLSRVEQPTKPLSSRISEESRSSTSSLSSSASASIITPPENIGLRQLDSRTTGSLGRISHMFGKSKPKDGVWVRMSEDADSWMGYSV